MELQQLRYVIAVAEERSFTRAAHRCLVVQSALSHQIKALERELGVKLFARTSRRVELTEAGTAFTARARAALANVEQAAAEAIAATGDVRGTLRLGVIPTVTQLDLPAVLGSFHRRYPEVSINLTTGGSDQFIAQLKSGDLDIAILGLDENTPPQGVAAQILAHERLVAVVAPTHCLAARQSIKLDEIAADSFVDFPAGSPGRLPTDRAFEAAGLQRSVSFSVTDIPLMLELVRQGLVTALLSADVVPQQDPGLRTLPIVQGPARIEYLAYSRFNPSPATRAFLDSLNLAR